MRFSHFLRFLLALLLFGFEARAETPAQIPNPLETRRSFVADGAGVIDAASEAKINALLVRLEKENGAEIAVVTVRSLGGQDIESFANDLFQRWGIGKKNRDNGALILAAMGDRKYRVEVGYGLEGTLPDGKAGALLRETLPPAFRRGAFGDGFYAATLALVREIEPALLSNSAPKTGSFPAAPREVLPDGAFSPPVRVPETRAPETGLPTAPRAPVASPGFSGLWLVFGALFGAIALIGFLAGRPPKCEKCRGEMDELPDDEVRGLISPEQQFE